MKKLIITNPPDFYSQDMNLKIQSSLIRGGFNISNFDLNFHLNISNFNFNDYLTKTLWRNARKNLSISLKSQLRFRKVDGAERINAYNVILKNRIEKGYDLKLGFSDLEANSKFIDIQFFIVEKGDLPIAAAVVYRV